MKGRVSLRSLLAAPPPSVAIEIAPRRVTAVAVERDRRGLAVLAQATLPLPEGALVPALNTPNVRDPDALAETVQGAVARLGRRVRRAAVAVPDLVAKVAVVRFEKIPERPDDLAQLIRWQVRRTAPFRLEEAQLAYCLGARLPEGGREIVVVLARRDIVEEYERACLAAGVQPGYVELASFGLVNLALAAGEGRGGRDWLLVHATPAYTSIAILRGETLLFFRNRPAEGDGDVADLVHQTAMYYEDRLGGSGLARVLAAGLAGGESEPARRALETRLGVEATPIGFAPVVTLRHRLSADAALVETLAAPIGLLVHETASTGTVEDR
jgi:type IV pilus assembly protein PilM